MHPFPSKKSLFRGLFRLLAHEYLLESSLHSCSSSRFSTIYSKNPIPTDLEIVCEMGVIVYEMGVIVYEMGNSCARWVSLHFIFFFAYGYMSNKSKDGF